MKVNCCNKIVLNLNELSVLLRHVTDQNWNRFANKIAEIIEISTGSNDQLKNF